MNKPSPSITSGQHGLKVGFVFDDSLDSVDGVSQYVRTLGAWLTKQGHKVSYLVGETKLTTWSGGNIYSLAKNKRVNFNGNLLSIPLPASKKKIQKLLKEEKFDVLHVQVPYSPLMAQRVINTAGPQTAIVGTFHIMPANLMVSYSSRLLNLAYMGSLKRFDGMMSVSPAAAKFARDVFKIESAVVPNVVDTDRFMRIKSAPKRHGPKKEIVFLGRLVERKGCKELLRAFKLVTDKDPKVHLTLAGDGPEKKSLQRYVKKHNLSGRVDFLGFIDEKDKPALLARADVACFPSLYGESFGIVLLEAMAAGYRTVLGGDNPGYRSVLGDHPKLLVDPRDTVGFAHRLNELLTDKKLAEEIKKWQKDRIKRYEVDTVGKKVLSIYSRAVDKRTQAVHN